LGVGSLFRRLERAEALGMPDVRRTRYEVEAGMRTEDRWFLIHLDAVAIGAVLSQTTRRTPRKVIEVCRECLHRYDEVLGNGR